jgi:hypothetical protein
LCGAGALARVLFALQQTLGVFGREPAAIFRDADGYHLIFGFIDCVYNGCGGEQGDLVFAAASAEENADSNLCCGHADSSLAFDAISVNVGGGYGGAKATTKDTYHQGH